MVELIAALLGIVDKSIPLVERYLDIRAAEGKQVWAQTVQAGLQPLEQGGKQPITDEQRLAAVKAVADAWANIK